MARDSDAHRDSDAVLEESPRHRGPTYKLSSYPRTLSSSP